ncbi:MAG TPA: hypothetical protein VH116_06730, partial [Gemmatimonadales bacterium]|nr:hypothetical protein [Gemmatimonadales bacterium]
VVAGCGSSTSPANSCGSVKADANVNATDTKNYSPSATTITHGQTVCWQNNGSLLHSVTDNGGAFDTDLPVGQVFTHTYPTVGTFAYHCKYHTGMTGTITVN